MFVVFYWLIYSFYIKWWTPLKFLPLAVIFVPLVSTTCANSLVSSQLFGSDDIILSPVVATQKHKPISNASLHTQTPQGDVGVIFQCLFSLGVPCIIILLLLILLCVCVVCDSAVADMGVVLLMYEAVLQVSLWHQHRFTPNTGGVFLLWRTCQDKERSSVRHEGLCYSSRGAEQGCGDSEKGISSGQANVWNSDSEKATYSSYNQTLSSHYRWCKTVFEHFYPQEENIWYFHIYWTNRLTDWEINFYRNYSSSTAAPHSNPKD